ncbi:hypothetical protein Bca101_007757 [Brassica carinata]
MKELRPIKESGSAEDFEKEALIQRFRGCSSSGKNYNNESKIVRRFRTSSAAEEIISRFTFYTQLLNNGNFVDAASGKTLPTLDPCIGGVIANIAESRC